MIRKEICRGLNIAAGKGLIAFLAATFHSKFGRAKNHCVRLMVISPTVQSRAGKKPLRWLNGYFPTTTPGLEKNH
ncbi:hypothetical protein, partial [Phormidium sp. CCY1219]|uniref:hypothetical protein n=1 Tax=Phormidium sp. CCY1219 TaxID=2886104 RepID=UPI002D1F0471